MDKRIYWVWLSLKLDVATTTYQKLLSAFSDDVINIYNATRQELSVIKLTPRQLNALCDKSTEEAQIIVDWCDNNNVGILCYDDANYPKRLASVSDAPIVLYYIGELYDMDNMLCIAGVGTREMTKYGYETAYTFSYDLASSGAVIVSGLANGIDSTCHRAALDAGGKTVAVLGCRINKVYPSNNRDLMVEIAHKGLILTEYHPFYKTVPANFPKRNRIISALSQATIVFEADTGSGSLITANYALKQGRNVYSLPGEVGNSGSMGTNELIREGAKIAVRSGDIIADFKYLYPELKNPVRAYNYSPSKDNFDSFATKRSKNNPQAKKQSPEPKAESNEPIAESAPPELTPVEAEIYSALDFNVPMVPEQIYLPNVSPGEVMSAYTMLELKGYIELLPGNKYRKLHK